jgi:hypothetical protein
VEIKALGDVVRLTDTTLLGASTIGAENSYLILSADGSHLYRLVLTTFIVKAPWIETKTAWMAGPDGGFARRSLAPDLHP